MSAETMSLVEKVAMALWPHLAPPSRTAEQVDELRPKFRDAARAALRALGVTEEMMQGPADAVVVVPVEASPDMLIKGGIAWCEAEPEAETPVDAAHACWGAMLAHRPGAPE